MQPVFLFALSCNSRCQSNFKLAVKKTENLFAVLTLKIIQITGKCLKFRHFLSSLTPILLYKGLDPECVLETAGVASGLCSRIVCRCRSWGLTALDLQSEPSERAEVDLLWSSLLWPRPVPLRWLKHPPNRVSVGYLSSIHPIPYASIAKIMKTLFRLHHFLKIPHWLIDKSKSRT